MEFPSKQTKKTKKKHYKGVVELFLNITIMKQEENKKQDELKDEQLDNVSGGVKVKILCNKKSDFNPNLP